MTIENKYPAMFQNCFGGVDIPPHWEMIIDRLCGLITAHRDRKNLPPMEVQQIKEKFAGLRFYNNGEFPYETKMIKYADKACRKICDVCKNYNEDTTVSTYKNNSWLINICPECLKLK